MSYHILMKVCGYIITYSRNKESIIHHQNDVNVLKRFSNIGLPIFNLSCNFIFELNGTINYNQPQNVRCRKIVNLFINYALCYQATYTVNQVCQIEDLSDLEKPYGR